MMSSGVHGDWSGNSRIQWVFNADIRWYPESFRTNDIWVCLKIGYTPKIAIPIQDGAPPAISWFIASSKYRGTGVTFAPTSESHSPLSKLGSHSPLLQWESLGITTIWCQINQPPFNNYIHFLSNLVFTREHDSCHSTASHLFVASCSQQPPWVYWGEGEHSTYIIRFEALCSQQPFGVYWGGGRGGNILLTSSLCKVVNFFL